MNEESVQYFHDYFVQNVFLEMKFDYLEIWDLSEIIKKHRQDIGY